MIKLLLVEDDPNLAYIVSAGLEDMVGGYEVTTAGNGAEGLEAWKTLRPDIIVSDIDMPVMDGFEMVRRIREIDNNVAILFTSALTSPKDVKRGYALGVNNYIKKPFAPDELDAHIHAILQMKAACPERGPSSFQLGAHTLDSDRGMLRDDRTDKWHTLTVRESELLKLLAEHKNEVVRREVILSRFWNTEDDYFASRSLDVFVTKLRKLFEDDPQVEIRTVRGVGITLEEHPDAGTDRSVRSE